MTGCRRRGRTNAGNWLFVLVLGNAAWGAESRPWFQPVRPSRKVAVMARFGEMPCVPRNSRPAVRRAIEDRFEWLLVDVCRSKDDVHVLFKNSRDLSVATNGRGPVRSKTLAELKRLDAGSSFAERFQGERVLTLAECLSLCRRKINLALDCKDVDPAALAREILAAEMEDQVVVFDGLANLRLVRETSDGVVGTMTKWRPPLNDDTDASITTFVSREKPAMVQIDAGDLDPRISQRFRSLGVLVLAKSSGERDNAEFWDRARAGGVDILQTDFPEEVLARNVALEMTRRPVKFCLHRGASRYVPENTLAAVAKSIRLHADFVELDIRASVDQGLFIMHDATVDRTTDGQGPIARMNGEVIGGLDAGIRFGNPFRGERVPRIEECLRLMDGKIEFYADAKNVSPAELVRALRQFDFVDRTVIYQGPAFLAEVKRLEPRAKVMPPLVTSAAIDVLVKTLQPHAVDASWNLLSKKLIERCHANGILVFSDAPDEDVGVEAYRRVIEWGIDLIQTDRPLDLLRAMEILDPQQGAR